MNLEQALIEKDNLEAALRGEIRKFEAATGLHVDSLRLVRIDSSRFGEDAVIVRVESRVLLEGAGQ